MPNLGFVTPRKIIFALILPPSPEQNLFFRPPTIRNPIPARMEKFLPPMR
jgi:hypothetical protein